LDRKSPVYCEKPRSFNGTSIASRVPESASPPRVPESASALTTTSDRGIPTGVSASTGSAEAHPAALVMSASVRSRGLRREGHFDPLLTQEFIHSKKHTFYAILAKCLKISDEMRNNNGMRNISAGFI
jgi:hypothetical protein